MITSDVITYGKCTKCGERFPTTKLKFLPDAEKYFRTKTKDPSKEIDTDTCLCPECMDKWLAANPQ